jgi:hypothetical protein
MTGAYVPAALRRDVIERAAFRSSTVPHAALPGVQRSPMGRTSGQRKGSGALHGA